MKTLDYRNLSVEDLATRLDESQREYISIAGQIAQGTEKNSAKLKGLRREIARIKTIVNEKRST